MTSLDLINAPSLLEFERITIADENARVSITAHPEELRIISNGNLRIKTDEIKGEFPVSEDGYKDLALKAKIPSDFFVTRLDPEAKAFVWNRCIREPDLAEQLFEVTIKEGVADKISNGNFHRIGREKLIRDVAESVPHDMTSPEDTRVISYELNGIMDLSIISTSLVKKLKGNDEIFFGISVLEDREGAIQIGGAVYRRACSNGAIIRECIASQQRIRRLDADKKENAEKQPLEKIFHLSQKAWRQWERNAEGLKRLQEKSITERNLSELRGKLRIKPFFLSADASRKTINHVRDKKMSLTLYSVFNAMTYLGTHDRNLSYNERYRLRLGGGILAQREVHKSCELCRQLILN